MSEYEDWTTEDIISEIRREEDLLAGYRNLLSEAQTARGETEKAIEQERLISFEERYAARTRRIQELTEALSEYDRQIDRWQEKVRSREAIISGLEASITRQEARAVSPYVSIVERMIARETARRLRRSRTAHLGWLTRERRTLERLRELREWTSRRITAYRTWQVREEPYVRRLEQLRTDLQKWISEITRLQGEIASVEAELEKKREELKKRHFLSHVIVSVEYRAERKMFEIHEIMYHRTPTPSKEEAIALALEMLLDYFAVEAIQENVFLSLCDFIYGEVQTKPVSAMPATTHGVILDVKTAGSPVRRTYEITWWIETTLEGEEKIMHSIKEVEKIEPEDLKKEWTEAE